MGLSRKDCERMGLNFDTLYAKALPVRVPDVVADKAKSKAARGRGVMNYTEARFANHLEFQRIVGQITAWEFEADTLRLAPDMTYTPDFKVFDGDKPIRYYDVKGRHTWEDSIIKGKAAAVIFPQHEFYLAIYVRAHLDARGNYRMDRWRIRRLGVSRS
jgi:hypothetical protein